MEIRVIDWRPLRNLVVAIILISIGVYLYTIIEQRRSDISRFMTSPCGGQLVSNGYILGDFYFSDENLIKKEYYDDGTRVWKIEKVIFPNTNGLEPKVEWKMVMERTPLACAEWQERTKIDISGAIWY